MRLRRTAIGVATALALAGGLPACGGEDAGRAVDQGVEDAKDAAQGAKDAGRDATQGAKEAGRDAAREAGKAADGGGG